MCRGRLQFCTQAARVLRALRIHEQPGEMRGEGCDKWGWRVRIMSLALSPL